MTARLVRHAGGLHAPRFLTAALAAPGLAFAILAFGVFASPVAAGTAGLPKDPDALVEMIETAITEKDYAALKALVYWEGAGKIKQRIVRFELNSGLGRKIHSIAFEDFPKTGMDGVLATGKLEPNMTVTNRVRVVFDEPVLAATGKRPTSVFLVGKIDDEYRIGLVNRTRVDDDDD